jgi:hypothetical protein
MRAAVLGQRAKVAAARRGDLRFAAPSVGYQAPNINAAYHHGRRRVMYIGIGTLLLIIILIVLLT